jgi:hypothetical protein
MKDAETVPVDECSKDELRQRARHRRWLACEEKDSAGKKGEGSGEVTL